MQRVLVGTRQGKAIINWPAVFSVALIVGAAAGAGGAGMWFLLTQEFSWSALVFPLPLALGYFAGLAIRDRCRLPVDQLTALDQEVGEVMSVPHYRHTQEAPWFWLLDGIGVVMLAASWTARGEGVLGAILFGSGLLMLLFGAAFQTLAVVDCGDHLLIRFGPLPLFQRRIAYADIQAAQTGRTLFLDGWGIHLSLRGGWVWNLWGRDCVVIHLAKGVLRVGTDEPKALVQFLKRRLQESR